VSIQPQDDCITNGSNLQEQINNIRNYVCNNVPIITPTTCNVKVSNTDSVCDYLINKITSSTLTITETSATGNHKLNLEIPVNTCLQYINKVNSSDTCGYLLGKFSGNGAVAPLLDTTSGQQIKFVRQQITFVAAPQVISGNGACGDGIGSGTVLTTGWTSPSNTFVTGAPTNISGAFTINKTGVYDIGLVANFLLNGSATNAPSFIRAALVKVGSPCNGCGQAIAYGTIYCTSQATSYSSCVIKGLTLNSGDVYSIKIFNTTGVATTTGGSNISLSFEFVGV
jgi:hypothetical protein